MKNVSLLLRIICSAALLAYLALRVDFHPLLEALPRFRVLPYILGVSAMAIYVCLQSALLLRLLAGRGVAPGWHGMLKFNLVSSFFGVFLPGGAGADVVMAVNLCRTSADKAGVLSAIAFARIAGLAAMVLLSFLVSLTPWNPVPGLRPILGALLAAIFGFILLARAGILDRIRIALFARPGRGRVVAFIDRMTHSFVESSGAGRGAGRLWVLLLLMGLFRGFMDFLMARALGIDLPYPMFLVFSTVVSLATLLPISIAGLGVREMTFAGLFAQAGVPQALAVSVSLLSFSLTLWVCVAGGVWYAVGDKRS